MNQYFDSSIDPDFVFANSALKNINFALVALDYILDDYVHYENTIGIYHDEHKYFFYHIQALLTACGNINNIFFNNSNWKNKTITERCARLRRRLGITKAPYRLIFQKEARNTNEHFDERYDMFNSNIGDYNVLYENMDNDMRNVILKNPHLRTYDKTKHIYYTYGRNRNPISYDLEEMKNELVEMREKIKDNSITNSAWINEYPNEFVE